MASLFRELSRVATKANIGKNSFKVFNTLVEQTLGYAKGIDNLSDRRLAYLSNVRIDRFRPALKVVLDLGLFDQIPAKKYQYHYRIGKTFLDKHGDKPFYTPAISKQAWKDLDFDTPDVPKNRADFQKTEAISEKERHTALDLNHSLSILLTPLQTLLNTSVEMLQQQMQQQLQIMQQQMQQQAQLISLLLQNQPNPLNPNSAIESTLPTDIEQTHCNFQKTEQKPNHSKKQTKIETEPSESVPMDNNMPVDEALPLPQVLVKLIPETDHPECQNLLKTLKAAQQRDLFVVYEDMAKRKAVRFPMPLFKELIKRAKKNALTLPQAETEANKPLHPSMIIETPAMRAAREEEEAANEGDELREMLRINSKIVGTTVEKLAEKMLLTHLLPV